MKMRDMLLRLFGFPAIQSASEAPVDDGKLRSCLLERRIEALKDATSRSRSTWLFATLLTSVFATVIYNHSFSHTKNQVLNRARLLEAVMLEKAELDKLKAQNETLRSIFDEGKTGVGYLKHLYPASTASAAAQPLQDMVKLELQEYVKRKITFDALTIPLIGVSISATDIGVVGGIALTIVGFWLVATLRREYHAFFPFVIEIDGRHEANMEHYTLKELAYAYHSVCQHMVFTISKSGSPINFLTAASFLFPPILIFLNYGATLMEMANTRILGDYLEPRPIAEFILVFSVGAVWYLALRYQLSHQ